MKRLLVCLISLVLLTSCGGGGGSNSISTFESPIYSATYSTAQLSSLYYEASPSGLTGTLVSGGRFSFKAGDVVTFYISESNKFLVAKSLTLPMSFTDLNTQNVEIQKPLLSAYYVDAPVKGLIYENSLSGLKGVTDESGRFRFFERDEVRYYLDPVNRIYLGRVLPSDGQIVIPPIATEFDSQVDSTFVPLILYTFDKALAGSNFMDLSDLVLNTSVATKVKNVLSKKEMPNGILDIWQSMASLQSEATGYSFRNSGNKLSKLEFNLSLFNAVREISALELREKDYLGVHYLSYGIAGAHLNFLSDGSLIGVNDDGTLSTGVYIRNTNNLSYRWSNNPPNSCNYIINLRQRGDQWSLITISEDDTPSGCVHNINHNDTLKKAKINESVNINFVSGKRLRIPANGFCKLGDGEAIFTISSNGSSARERVVEVISPLCTGNQQVSGIVKETGMPGILVFEFNTTSPKIKFFFSTLQEEGRALTQFSVEKTAPSIGFDIVYGVETTFTLE